VQPSNPELYQYLMPDTETYQFEGFEYSSLCTPSYTTTVTSSDFETVDQTIATFDADTL